MNSSAVLCGVLMSVYQSYCCIYCLPFLHGIISLDVVSREFTFSGTEEVSFHLLITDRYIYVGCPTRTYHFNPLRPNNDESQTSHCNIKGVSVSEVMRIQNMITQVLFY